MSYGSRCAGRSRAAIRCTSRSCAGSYGRTAACCRRTRCRAWAAARTCSKYRSGRGRARSIRPRPRRVRRPRSRSRWPRRPAIPAGLAAGGGGRGGRPRTRSWGLRVRSPRSRRGGGGPGRRRLQGTAVPTDPARTRVRTRLRARDRARLRVRLRARLRVRLRARFRARASAEVFPAGVRAAGAAGPVRRRARPEPGPDRAPNSRWPAPRWPPRPLCLPRPRCLPCPGTPPPSRPFLPRGRS